MAIRKEATIARYTGLSTDEQPYVGMILANGQEIKAVDLPPGSSLLTEKGVLRWNGREWMAEASPEVIELREIKALLIQLVDELRSEAVMGF